MSWFRKNLPLKLLAILGAIVLWLYVANVGYRADFLDEEIPLELHNVPLGFSVVKDADAVRLKVRAQASQWETLNRDNFSAYLDLKGLEEGDYDLEVKVTANDSGAQIIEKIPRKVNIRLEKTVTETIPITVETEGELGESYKTLDPTLSVEEAEVKGARSQVKSVAKILAKVRLKGEEEEVVQNVELKAVDQAGAEIADLEIEPKTVEVKIPVQKETGIKTVGINADIVGSPKEGYVLGEVTLDPDTVSIQGRLEELSGIEYLETVPIDISGADADMVKSIGLSLPSGVEVVGGGEVAINIKISSQLASRSLSNIIISPQNLGSGLELRSISPSRVTITVSGPADKVNALKESDFSLKLDLSGKREGTVDIQVVSQNVSGLEGVSVESVDPKTLRVVIEKKK